MAEAPDGVPEPASTAGATTGSDGVGAVRHRRDLLVRQVLDGVLVLAPDEPSDRPHHLPGTAADVWAGLADWATVPELAAALAERFAAPAEHIEADVLALVAQLLELGLLETVSDSAVDHPGGGPRT